MKPIAHGQSGAAVEDVQQRLVSLGYKISKSELDASLFGNATRKAVRAFRSQQGLPAGDTVDDATWVELVDETYKLGDRTLYLRLPYFRGADVSHLQTTLNVLGFSCGQVDGLYGPHTETAVREFQANMGILADGMAFQDTFDAIERLHHVWMGKTASPEFSVPHMGFARAVNVLEERRIVVGATDPIARNVANRLWNVACATTGEAQVRLFESEDFETLGAVRRDDEDGFDLLLIVSTAPLGADEELPAGTVNIVCDEDARTLTQRLSATVAGCPLDRPCCVRTEFADLNRYDGSVTGRVVQTTAIGLLDAVCSALNADTRTVAPRPEGEGESESE